MARDFKSEHRGGLHEESALGSQGKCEHCDPWSTEFIEPKEVKKKEIKDTWTDAWVESQKGK